MPCLFFRSGTVADKYSIMKINSFGDVVEEYSYKDVTDAEISIKLGVQYEITFDTGDSIDIISHKTFLIVLETAEISSNLISLFAKI